MHEAVASKHYLTFFAISYCVRLINSTRHIALHAHVNISESVLY